MNIKKYCLDRKLEMVGESQALENKRKTLITQGQQLQAQLNMVNEQIIKLNIELELITNLESKLNGNKEVV